MHLNSQIALGFGSGNIYPQGGPIKSCRAPQLARKETEEGCATKVRSENLSFLDVKPLLAYKKVVSDMATNKVFILFLFVMSLQPTCANEIAGSGILVLAIFAGQLA